jgi:membrane-associated phospholipid phosphatase
MDSTVSRPPADDWISQVGVRLRAHFLAKMFSTTIGMTLFFVAYFWVLRNPHYPVTIMPVVALDRLIGFHPAALPLYLSLWFYVSLAPALLTDPRELVSYGLVAIGLGAIGLWIFYLWPTAVPIPEIDWLRHPTFSFLKSVDASGNACPSLHVAFAVFTAVWFERLLRELSAGGFVRAANWLWCLGILYSTVAIKQHVALDVLAGAVLGGIVAALHLRYLRVLPLPIGSAA